MTRLVTASAVALALLVPGLAHAASGTIHGYWKNYQNQGNYCDPATRNCTSARYLKSEYNIYHPISDTKVYVKDNLGAVIGQGVTSASGFFNIVWNRTTTPTHVRVYWQFENKDDRFKVRGEGGGVLAMWTAPITVTAGNAVNAGTWLAGTSTSISGLANIYDGADRMWNEALRYSNLMLSVFTGLTIRAFPDDCPTACASSGSNLIKMPEGSEFKPQGRILHEMGHIAAGVASGAAMDPGSYCYPLEETPGGATCSDGSNNGWSMTSSEWRGVALKEGMATLFGDVAIYWGNAVDPRTCLSSGPCAASGTLEDSVGCSGTVGRRALQMDRYFWDIYDSPSDGSDDVDTEYYAFFDTLNAIPSGTSWGQLSSYRDGSNNVDCWDCFHPWEWRNALLNHWGGATESQDAYFQNCMGWF
jgi:hypothetical protein